MQTEVSTVWVSNKNFALLLIFIGLLSSIKVYSKSLDLQWSIDGTIDGKTCVSFNNPTDPNAWVQNYLCSSVDLELKTFKGHEQMNSAISNGYTYCVEITEPADPDGWNETYLCSKADLGLHWSSHGPITGQSCIQIFENAEPYPHTWWDNFLCSDKNTILASYKVPFVMPKIPIYSNPKTSTQINNMQQVTTGANIYSNTLLRDHGKVRMWFSGELNSLYPVFDDIYYMESLDADGKNWQDRSLIKTMISHNDYELTLAMQEQVKFQLANGEVPLNTECARNRYECIDHVGDPSVTMDLNQVTQSPQYTMFFTVCPKPCRETPTFNQNEIWSAVSSDGMNWGNYQVLLRGTSSGPAEASVVYDPDPALGSVWKVYYINRIPYNDVSVAYVNGLRQAIKTQNVYTWKQEGIISSVEVRKTAKGWSMFFQNYLGYVIDKKTGEVGPANSDIYEVDSENNLHWISGSEYPLITHPIPTQGTCGAITPGVLVSATNPMQFDLFFTPLTTSYAISTTDGALIPFCPLLGKGTNIQRWTFERN